MNNKRNINITKNHTSQKGKSRSSTQISLRFQLLDDCNNERIVITDDIRDALQSDKAFVEFTYETGYEDGDIKAIALNTVRSHGKLAKMQRLRGKVHNKLQAIVLAPAESKSDETSKPKTPKKETKTSLKADKEQLEECNDQINAQLITLRSAYKELLVAVKRELPYNDEIKKIIGLHNKSSLIRKSLKRQFDGKIVAMHRSKNDN